MGNDSSFIDELLNFSAPEKEQLEKEDLQTPGSSSHRETEVRQTDSSGLINFDDDDEVGVEEDLEWMTNQDAFPMIPLEHLGVLTEQFNLFPSEQFDETSLTEEKQLSPISVLETSSSHGSTTTNTTSNSSGPSTTAMATTTSLMNYCVGFKAPSKERSKRLRRGRSDMQVLWTSNGNEQGGGVEKKMKMTSSVVTPAVIIGRKCQHCGTEKTPQWRAGPLGAKTLCNACGVRYKSGRLYPEYRPVNSPSFTPELHSNSHRRVVEMRKKFQSGDGDQKNCE